MYKCMILSIIILWILILCDHFMHPYLRAYNYVQSALINITKVNKTLGTVYFPL